MESTNGQRCANGCTQERSVGADAVVGHNLALLSSLEAHNTEQTQIPSCDVGDEVNGHPAIKRTFGSSNEMTKFERLDDRVSVIQCTALAISML